MWWKISVTKFQNSKIWDDSFKGFSVGFVMVYSVFSVGAIFMEKYAKQNDHFLTFWEKLKNTDFEGQISHPKMHFQFFSTGLSSCSVREDRFAPQNFYPGHQTRIFINNNNFLFSVIHYPNSATGLSHISNCIPIQQ